MARTRYIKTEFFEDTKIAELSVECRLLYIGLWTLLDRNGVYDFDPKKIKKNIFGYDDKITVSRVSTMLSELIKYSFFKEIDYGDKKYLYCPNFVRHQKFHREEKPKYLIPLELLNDALLAPNKHPTSTQQEMTNATASSAGNGERGTGNGQRATGNLVCATTVQAPPLPPEIASRLDSLSSKAKQLLGTVKEDLILSWWESYKDADFIIAEANAAATWILAQSHKAPKNFGPFFSRWLKKGWEDYRKTLKNRPISEELSYMAKKIRGVV